MRDISNGVRDGNFSSYKKTTRNIMSLCAQHKTNDWVGVIATNNSNNSRLLTSRCLAPLDISTDILQSQLSRQAVDRRPADHTRENGEILRPWQFDVGPPPLLLLHRAVEGQGTASP